MSKTDSLHYDLCRKAAAFLRNKKNQEHTRQMKRCPEDSGWHSPWLWSAVEMMTPGTENCDVWATNGRESVVVEVKVSRADFLRDRKKRHLQPGNEHLLSGNFRYYLAPEGVIGEEDLPEDYGLLVWDGKKIVKKRQAAFRVVTSGADLARCCSILRREGVLPRTYDYRNTSTMGMSRIASWMPTVLKPCSKAIETLYGHLFGDFDARAVLKDFEQGRLALFVDGQGSRLSYCGDGYLYHIDTRTLKINQVKVQEQSATHE